jgi:hypothetical protein
VAALLLGTLAVSAPVAAKHFSDWGAPSRDGLDAVNTTALEGCAMQSPDGLSLYFASNRPRYEGDPRTDLDIYVSRRASTGDAWGAPENLGDTINSAANEFCPTPVRGKGLYFVSARTDGYGLGSSGAGDIYFTRLNPAHGWTTPANLGPGVNSALSEAGPSYFEADGRGFLYFSSGGAPNTSEIYVSEQAPDGSFGPRAAVAELNISNFDDSRPNVRKDGLEVVFDSNRDGFQGGVRNPDIWTATRASVTVPWLAPTNLGPVVNTSAAETRASFSWDGSTLYFGRLPGPVGSFDLFFTTR